MIKDRELRLPILSCLQWDKENPLVLHGGFFDIQDPLKGLDQLFEAIEWHHLEQGLPDLKDT